MLGSSVPDAVAKIVERLGCGLITATNVLLEAGRSGKLGAWYKDRALTRDDWLRLKYGPRLREEQVRRGMPLSCMWLGAEILHPSDVEADHADLMALIDRLLEQRAAMEHCPTGLDAVSADTDAPEVEARPTKNRGGRSPIYDWKAARHEFTKMAALDGLTTRAAAQQAILDWFAKQEQHPSDSILREHMADWWPSGLPET
jgi:hypothetical protein